MPDTFKDELPLNASTLKMLNDAFIEQYGRPGQIMVVNHLSSAKGIAMNGKRVRVVGLDPPPPTNTNTNTETNNRRVRVQLIDPNTQKSTGKILQIKPQNLIDVQHYSSIPSKSMLSKQMITKFLSNSIKGRYGNKPSPESSRDSYMRAKLIKRYLRDGEVPEKTTCMDLIVPPKNRNEFENMRAMIVPACVGDGFVDFTRFGEGLLVQNSDDSGVAQSIRSNEEEQSDECAICTERILSNLVRLPCYHRFHTHCVNTWLKDHNSCPICRKELINSFDTYIYPDVFEQIQKRFDEWFITGMCERCQAVNLELNPMVEVTDENGRKLCMPLTVARSNGFDTYENLQGKQQDKEMHFLTPSALRK